MVDVRRRKIRKVVSQGEFTPMNDALFKFLFGTPQRKKYTIDFLNAVLKRQLSHPIQDICFIRTEYVGKRKNAKNIRLDVCCELDSGETVNIEVQVVRNRNMLERLVYYASSMIVSKLDAGEEYEDLKPVIVIGILDFQEFDHKWPASVLGLADLRTGKLVSQLLKIHVLEIPKLVAQYKTRKRLSRMEKWMLFFAGKIPVKERETLFKNDEVIMEAMVSAKEFFKSNYHRKMYIDSELLRMDRNSELATAKAEGREEGRAEGLVEGRVEGRVERDRELMLKLLKEKRELSYISDFLSIPLEKVMAFARKHQYA